MIDFITTAHAVDLLILKEELSRSGELEQVGGITYIASLIDAVQPLATFSIMRRSLKKKRLAAFDSRRFGHH